MVTRLNLWLEPRGQDTSRLRKKAHLRRWSPRPFVWTAKVEDILEKLDRARRKLEEIKPGCTTRKIRKKAEPIV